MKINTAAKLALLFLLPVALSTQGHHGTYTFDGDTIITLEGEILQFNWTNPHSSVVMAVDNANGGRDAYFLEADGPSIMTPLGVTRDSLQPGDRVIAYVSPSRQEGSGSVLGREIIKADGTVIGLSVAYTRRMERGRPQTIDSIIGTWVPDQRSLFEFVDARASWPLTEAGERSLAAYDSFSPNFAQSACIPATSPTLLMYPTAKVFIDNGDSITLNADWMGASRTIHMDGREHPPLSERSLQGHSVGHWEDGALVVETVNFTDNDIGNAFGVASGQNKRLLERFELNDNGSTLSYHWQLEDRDYLTETVAGSTSWHYRPDIRPSGVECDVEAASRHLNE